MTAPDHDQEIADNRKLWDAWTAIHTTGSFYDVQRFRDDPTDVRIDLWERGEVGDVAGKRFYTSSAISGSTRSRGRGSARLR
jgi:hypothetical protein